MTRRGGVIVTTIRDGAQVVDIPAHRNTLPRFTVDGVAAHLSDSIFRQLDNGGIIIGTGAGGTGLGTIAIGGGAIPAVVTNTDTLQIGTGASAGTSGVALGKTANANGGAGSIAIGENANARGANVGGSNIAIGRNAAFGGSGGLGIAFGNLATVNSPGGAHIAFGSSATVNCGLVNGSIAFGANTNVTHGAAVAIGLGATTTQDGEYVFGDINNGPVTLVSFRPAAAVPIRHRNSAAGWAIRNVLNTLDIFKVDESAVAGDMRLLLWDVTAAALKRVKIGAAGTGPGGIGQMLFC